MGRCFDMAHEAYGAGDGARAKQLSNEGHVHQKARDDINSQAADWIFHENNKNSPEGTVDLHGLYVEESIHYTEQAITDAQTKRLPQLRVIVGKGIHSYQHVQKIKPAVEKIMRQYNLRAALDPHNAGVLIVQLDGTGSAPSDLGWARDLPRDSSRGLDKEQDDGCSIM